MDGILFDGDQEFAKSGNKVTIPEYCIVIDCERDSTIAFILR